jgi:hypothetical protein
MHGFMRGSRNFAFAASDRSTQPYKCTHKDERTRIYSYAQMEEKKYPFLQACLYV